MVDAAAGRRLIEMGGRRTHEEAAVAAARSAYLAGFASTSNLEAGRRYGIPTAGTAAHAFTLVHDSERAAFASQVEALGAGTTLLVDTFDIAAALRTAVEVANEAGASGPGAVRIDSGDLAEETRRARALLDELGATETRIVVSSDLDEYLIEELVSTGAPVDAFGVGTRVVTGSGHPTAGFVYKLVAVDGRPVAKRSASKVSAGGRKRAWRLLDDDGVAVEEHVVPAGALAGAPPGRDLQVVAMSGGERCHDPTADEIRRHHRAALDELRPPSRCTAAGEPVLTAAPKEAL
jgi:putative nicotinate phosphoribosyltransferase